MWVRDMRGGSTHQYTESELNCKLIMELDSYLTSPIIPESVLKQKYLENRFTTRAIASEFSCSNTYVRSLLQKYNIPLRKQSKRRGSRWYAYGRCKVNGKTIDHQGEQRTIATIKQMYSEGISTNAIARFLNTMTIPTKQLERGSDGQASMNEVNGKGWHANTIIKILKREGVYALGKVLT